MAANVGTGLEVIANAVPEEVPPPGVEFTTVTVADPAEATSAAAIAAVTCVALTYVVTRLAPFHCTCDAATNPAPFTVNANAPDPAVAVAGEMPDTLGAGLFTVNVAAVEVPPPGVGLTTVTAAVPAAATSAARMAAVSCVALT
jgi:hypothetical protein